MHRIGGFKNKINIYDQAFPIDSSARILKISESEVRGLIDSGELIAKGEGEKLMIPFTELTHYKERKENLSS